MSIKDRESASFKVPHSTLEWAALGAWRGLKQSFWVGLVGFAAFGIASAFGIAGGLTLPLFAAATAIGATANIVSHAVVGVVHGHRVNRWELAMTMASMLREDVASAKNSIEKTGKSFDNSLQAEPNLPARRTDFAAMIQDQAQEISAGQAVISRR